MANLKTTLTASNIKYLLAIYQLTSDNKGIRCVRIAEQLEVTKPSVHTMMNTLKDMSLIKKNHYGEVFFTDEGLKLAKKYNGYYQFVSNMLAEYLSNEWDIRNVSCAVLAEVSEEALEQLCCSISKKKKVFILILGAVLLGAIIGLPTGIVVLYYLLKMLASEYEIKLALGPVTYFVSLLLTFGVSLSVSLMVSRKNKKLMW